MRKGITLSVLTVFCLALALAPAALAAEPKYSVSKAMGPKIEGGITDEFIGQLKEDEGLKAGKPLRLGKGITDDDLKKLPALADYVKAMEMDSCEDITDLTPLASLTGLEKLKMYRLKGVTTLEPLAALVNMKDLEIRQVEYPDIKFVSGMKQLESLVFFMQPKNFSDISPLEGLTSLKTLHFYSCPIEDISVLAGLTGLEDLSLYMTAVKDLEPIGGLTGLKRLSLYAVKAKDMTPVGNLTNLEYIWVYATDFDDYSPLAKLVNMVDFNAGLSALDTLEYLVHMPKLKIVKLLNEDIHDFTPLAEMPQLEEVNLEGVKGVVDLSVFKDHKKLVNLFVRKCKLKNPEAITALPKLEWIILIDSEGVDDITIFKDMPKIKRISVKKGQYPDEQLEAVGKLASVN